MPQPNPVPIILASPWFWGGVATLGAGAYAYFTGRQEGYGVKQEEARLRDEINRQGGVLQITNQPIFPPPAAPQTREEMLTWTPEQMMSQTHLQSRAYQANWLANIVGERLPGDTLDEYTLLEKGLFIGVLVLGAWAIVK